VERPGAPELILSNVAAHETKLTFTLSQNQKGMTYPLDLPIRIDTTGDTEHRIVRLENRSQSYTLTTKAKPVALQVDPDIDVFRRLSDAETPPILRDITLDPDTQLVALGNVELRDLAHDLAGHLLQTRLRMLESGATTQTVIIAGPRDTVRAHLANNNLPPAPPEVSNHGDARAWTARTPNGQTLLIVEAEDTDGFTALSRVLPHYKRRSYVIMENGKTVDKGTWPPGDGPLTVRLK
jgi:hypothetical protein